MTKEKTYHFFHQVSVISIVLLISKMIESFMPIPMPASVIGLVLLFICLCTGIIKLGQVEKVGTALTDNIGLLFVPAGISVIKSLGLLAAHPILILGLIFISTLLLLLCTGFFSQMIVKMTDSKVKTKVKKETKHLTGIEVH
ncbi:antiholin-like murein hydrolase modulator LrgA [Macrococcus armenti]|uniref:antiholin-like murein hydrolase modulator LrgA n=1 Tax=Macrococcus armenti TaxID=2875764 RepID=UPI001CCFAEC4|nr:antiholin-like murein hydrolase modulator LrgA [Macrococcus armenti]UBH08707.1 antiholin-like murein hydrolase modulator LrgA [Macrococcus armenti]UBH11005.1 antiholin-like murein hydrolase modulator LrgA [Macrococcus armenti]UBH15482.1 antiholin-like murein hydrolase modulator LrgA [Macrococcus armenti]UBH17842.1 antiholin-like murein hydrolase modulator LrgA [Macrococcus armenti]UBH20107.1 antiholin-like murein hydrolase modulator LrgA [Macrococcus armenti]